MGPKNKAKNETISNLILYPMILYPISTVVHRHSMPAFQPEEGSRVLVHPHRHRENLRPTSGNPRRFRAHLLGLSSGPMMYHYVFYGFSMGRFLRHV